MTERGSALVTLLFTDLVGSTELLSRAGDEQAQRIFRAHHQLLADAVASHHGDEVKWLGDGLMVAFASAADAIGCAIAMQRASRRPVQGERLAIRVGLNAGEALRDAADFFGTPVVVARRLCDRAEGGQILCTDLVAGLLHGHAGFAFSEVGPLELKGVPRPVSVLAVRYEVPSALGLPSQLPFVGREPELERLAGQLGETAAGHGGLVMVVGDPGIGKTRTAEELAERARREGMSVLWGHCVEGDWTPPYAPFAEAIETLSLSETADNLRADLGAGAAPLVQLVPSLRRILPDLPEAVPVQPDEERFRLLDAVAQLLVARSARAPVLLCLDDLQWADRSTVAMLRHVARFARGHRLLVLGTYRDAEVGPAHPLAEALGALRRDAEFERIKLEGLETKAVGQLLEALAEQDVTGAVAAAITAETDGNPFFIREVIRHLVEEGRFVRGPDGRWTADRPIREMGIPEGVREVISRRLARLGSGANRFLGAASLFEGSFRFDVVTEVAGLDDDTALDALDEALASQLLEPAGGIDVYAFTHALVRHTLADGLSPSRRGRLHLRVAEALASQAGPDPSPAQAGEIAAQYHRARGLPGAERGVEPALLAAAHSEATGAVDEAVGLLGMALELLGDGDLRRPRLLARLGIALAWARDFDEAVRVVLEASGAIALAEGSGAAMEFLSEATYACGMAGSNPHAWVVARKGLEYAGTKRDVGWARLVCFDAERRAAEESDPPGIPDESAERAESARILRAARLDPLGFAAMESVVSSREEALESTNLGFLIYWAGEYARCLPTALAEAEAAVARGRFARGARGWAYAAICQAALGLLDDARASHERAEALASRVGQPVFTVQFGRDLHSHTLGEGEGELLETFASMSASTNPALVWGHSLAHGVAVRLAAHRGDTERTSLFLERALPWLERAPAWAMTMTTLCCYCAEALWVLERQDHLAVVERALLEKIVAPDFRAPMVDARLALARLCALTGRYEEARRWFAEARPVLSEQGARPLLAVTDHDEALMHVRRGEADDLERARPLLDSARRQFEAIGMTGWIRRAEELRRHLGEGETAGQVRA